MLQIQLHIIFHWLITEAEAVSEAEVYHLIALHSDHNLVGCAVLRDFLPSYTLTGEEKYKHIPYEHMAWRLQYDMQCFGVLLAKCVQVCFLLKQCCK